MAGWGAIQNNLMAGLSQTMTQIAKLQEQASSGSRVIRASDDPNDASRILLLQGQSATYNLYLKNLDDVSGNLDMSSSVLQSISSSLTRVKSLISQAASGTYDQSNRQVIAPEIDSVLESILSLANTQNAGRFLFGGASDLSAPFQAVRDGDTITSVNYAGSSQDLLTPVAPQADYSGLSVGQNLFRDDRPGRPVLTTSTGLTVGSGTASMRGDAHFTLSHGATTYDAASGIAAGTSSADGDTILGNDHTLTVDSAAGTIRLDDGQSVNFLGTETDLKLTNAAGDVAYVDLTKLGPLFTGTVGITATANVSFDNNLTKKPLAVGGNSAVTDPVSGGLLYVDTTGLSRVGGVSVTVPGTHDVFNLLAHVRDTLNNTQGLSEDQQAQIIDTSLTSLDEVMGTVGSGMAAQGSRQQALKDLKTSLQALQDNANSQADQLGNADITQVATDLARTQSLYQMSLAATAHILQLSLLNYIQ